MLLVEGAPTRVVGLHVDAVAQICINAGESRAAALHLLPHFGHLQSKTFMTTSRLARATILRLVNRALKQIETCAKCMQDAKR